MSSSNNTYTSRCLFFLIIIALCASIIASCSYDWQTERQLDDAESLIVHNPDSTIAILVGMDTTRMSEKQKARQELLFCYTNIIYGNQIPIDSAVIAEGDELYSGKFDSDAVKWQIIKSEVAKRTGNPVNRIELLKDAEFSAIQLKDSVDLGIIYLFLSNVYQQGYNGTVARYYANKAVDIFNKLKWPNKIRESRMAIVGAYGAQRNYQAALDTLIAMEPEVMTNAHDSFKVYFLDELARSYDACGQSPKAIDIWHSIYDGGREISTNTLAHWADAYCHANELDSAEMLIRRALELPHSTNDEALCLNVKYNIIEKMGRKSELAELDSLRYQAAIEATNERHLEESSLALNMKYDSAAKNAWLEAAEARNHTNIAIFITALAVVLCLAIFIFLKKRNKMLRLEHENDILKIRTLQENLFQSNSRHKDMSARISELFQTRFNVVGQLATTYFECKDTSQEQKRIYSDVKSALSNFGTKESIGELTEIVNGYKENLMERFKADFPKLPASQYKLALYLFCGFSLPAVSIFTDTELRNIYVYKSRLKSLISKSDSPRKAEYLSFF